MEPPCSGTTAQVVTVLRGVANEIKKADGTAEIVGADLSRLDGPATLLAQIDKAFKARFAGRLDVLVNNAGWVTRKRQMRLSTSKLTSTYERSFILAVKQPDA